MPHILSEAAKGQAASNEKLPAQLTSIIKKELE